MSPGRRERSTAAPPWPCRADPRFAYTIHLAYRPASAEWAQRMAWANISHEPAWYEFVSRATPRQLALFGFPPPGHPYWTETTLAGTAQRYPSLDLRPWHEAVRT